MYSIPIKIDAVFLLDNKYPYSNYEIILTKFKIIINM